MRTSFGAELRRIAAEVAAELTERQPPRALPHHGEHRPPEADPQHASHGGRHRGDTRLSRRRLLAVVVGVGAGIGLGARGRSAFAGPASGHHATAGHRRGDDRPLTAGSYRAG